jgi:hypothetical protein
VTFSDEETYYFNISESIHKQRKEELKRNEFLNSLIKEAYVEKRGSSSRLNKLRSMNPAFLRKGRSQR